MKLYLDQMFRVELAHLLRAEGHDVLRAEEAGQARADDAEILEITRSEGRLLVTLDEHFGDWVVLPLSTHPGVLRVKVHPPTTAQVAALTVPFLARHYQVDFVNHLVILSARSVRWVKTG